MASRKAARFANKLDRSAARRWFWAQNSTASANAATVASGKVGSGPG